MATIPQVVCKCPRKIKGKICGGDVIEHRMPHKRFDRIIGPGQNKAADLVIGTGQRLPEIIFGPGEFAGYICQQCGKQYSMPPVDLKKLGRLVRKTLKELAKEDKKNHRPSR